MKSTLQYDVGKYLQCAMVIAPSESTASDYRDKSLATARVVDAGQVATHVQRRRRKPRFTDGPFTESKELIGGLGPPNAVRR